MYGGSYNDYIIVLELGLQLFIVSSETRLYELSSGMFTCRFLCPWEFLWM